MSEMEDYIKAGIKNCINEIIKEETEIAVERIRKKVRASAGTIAVNLATQFHVHRGRHEIIITFKDEDVRKEKK